MGLFENNLSPYLTAVEGTTPASPSAGQQRLFIRSSDHVLCYVNSSGVVTPVDAAGLSNPMTTKGDVILGDTGGTPTRLGAGTSTYVLTSNGAAAFPSWQAAAGGAQNNEAAAGTLINATSTGDAGNRADHFPGVALSGSWTQEGTAPTVAAAVVNSAVSFETADATSIYSRPYTPSGAFRIEARMRGLTGLTGLFVKDSAAAMTGEGMGYQLQTNILNMLSLDAGAVTGRQTVATGYDFTYQWLYVFLARDGSNNWTAGFSQDRNLWFKTASYSKTFTPAKICLRSDRASAWVVSDFIDVVL